MSEVSATHVYLSLTLGGNHTRYTPRSIGSEVLRQRTQDDDLSYNHFLLMDCPSCESGSSGDSKIQYNGRKHMSVDGTTCKFEP